MADLDGRKGGGVNELWLTGNSRMKLELVADIVVFYDDAYFYPKMKQEA